MSPDQIKNRSADPTNIGGGVARARDSHPPPQGPDRASDERATSDQTTGFLADIRQGSQAGQRRPRRQHPREQSYTSDLLSPDAEQIHELLVNHKLPLNSPTGMANLIAGKLGPLGNNKLTVARVKLAVEAVAERAEADAADGAPRSSDEVRAHLLSFLRYTDARWKELEKKLAADEPGPPPDAPAYHRPAPDEPVIDAMPPEEVARLSGELTKKLGLIGSGGMS